MLKIEWIHNIRLKGAWKKINPYILKKIGRNCRISGSPTHPKMIDHESLQPCGGCNKLISFPYTSSPDGFFYIHHQWHILLHNMEVYPWSNACLLYKSTWIVGLPKAVGVERKGGGEGSCRHRDYVLKVQEIYMIIRDWEREAGVKQKKGNSEAFVLSEGKGNKKFLLRNPVRHSDSFLSISELKGNS